MPVPVRPLLRSTLFRRAALTLCAVTTLVTSTNGPALTWATLATFFHAHLH